MNQPMIELPKYKSHKIVRALSIAAIEVHEDKSATIMPALTAYAPFKTQPGWAERFKGSEDDKGYYVVYDDGYASWSPTKAFEEGYAKVRELKETTFSGECDTILSTLQALIDSRVKRTLNEMLQLSDRLHSIASVVSKMELTEIQP